MTSRPSSPWLHRFAIFTAVATLALIGIGGLVTSKEAGMAVPDWPTSYGYHMFALPFTFWQGGAFHEHTHRVFASVVGLLTAILALWLWVSETTGRSRRSGIIGIAAALLVAGGMMGVRTDAVFVGIATCASAVIGFGIWQYGKFRGLRWLGVIALAAVILQGVLGGFRVVWFKDEIGIFHATLAQLFLVLIAVIALFTSRRWNSIQTLASNGGNFLLFRRWLGVLSVIVLWQLVLGATMRHQHAGLAVPDFPLAYGQIWPRLDAEFIDTINRQRLEVTDPNPITAAHIVVHMMHRITAVLIFLGVGWLALRIYRELGKTASLTRWTFVWFGVVCVQAVLGILTVLMNKPADVATAHVVLGAVTLTLGVVLTVVAGKISVERKNGMRHVSRAISVQPFPESNKV